MPTWKGKKVRKAHYFHLRRSVERRLIKDMRNWGFGYNPKPYKIGGNKNGEHIRTAMLWR
jgi:hypothetical protein